ncbi:predicted protein [Histoplasma mississippiense (nom. inval.)]|uniref:predicted protein n=1 Tax=Ajellomyces capsulatus (strain NAm1 / WU24) TaxID=2059318 RepID=UPI000157D53C|nr:predicted protein [Histoplasma mississippiense (nom. inval.)]EDN05415.1 predicted protein [Histoplasma mississippiense (nom. inval.)]
MGIKGKILMHYVNRTLQRIQVSYRTRGTLDPQCERNLRARLRPMKSARVFQCCRKTSFWISIIPAAVSRVWTERVSEAVGVKPEAASRVRAVLEIGWTRCYTKVEYVQLGSSGLRVSSPILGGMSIGHKEWQAWVVEEEEGLEAFKLRQSKDDVNLGDKTPPSHPKRP